MNRKVPASFPIFKDMACVRQHIGQVYKMDGQTLVVFDDMMRVHELSRFPGHWHSQNSEMSELLHWEAGTRWDHGHGRKGLAPGLPPRVCGLSWTLERGVPHGGCATAAQEEQGVSRTILGPSSLTESSNPSSLPLLCVLPILKTALRNTSVHWHHTYRKLPFLGSHC